MQDGGELHTIEYDDKYKEIIEQYVQKAGVQDRITLHFGSGLEVIPQLTGAFDMVFIDADKINYSVYYDLIFDQVPVGGYLIADNVLWSGKVTEDAHQFDKDTRALHVYNEKIALDPRVKHILLPLRDGLMVAQKIAQ
jgi:predicted O-methyltransferase YrrM